MQWVKLGDFITRVDNKNSDNTIKIVKSVSVTKEFKDTNAKVDKNQLSSYKIVAPRQISFVQTTGNEKCLCSAMNDFGYPIVVTSVNEVFETDEKHLLPEFLVIFLIRKETDRYARYHSWGSAREIFKWDDMCRVKIPLPSIDEQRVAINAWRGLKNLKEQNEQLSGPLMDLCQSYLQELKHKYPLVEIGPYIEEINQRNTDGKYSEKDVRGVSIQKEFIATKAKMEAVSVDSYKVVGPSQFAFNPNTARMGEKICVALNDSDSVYLVSAIYPVFRIKDASILLPEYLQLFFKREDFNRYARYHSWGSAREMFNFDDMCRVKIPLPPIEIQRAIVEIYNCAKTSKYISETAKQLVGDICPALMRQIIGDAQ